MCQDNASQPLNTVNIALLDRWILMAARAGDSKLTTAVVRVVDAQLDLPAHRLDRSLRKEKMMGSSSVGSLPDLRMEVLN